MNERSNSLKDLQEDFQKAKDACTPEAGIGLIVMLVIFAIGAIGVKASL